MAAIPQQSYEEESKQNNREREQLSTRDAYLRNKNRANQAGDWVPREDVYEKQQSYTPFHDDFQKESKLVPPYASQEEEYSHPPRGGEAECPPPNETNQGDWMRYRRKKQVAHDDDKDFNILSGDRVDKPARR